MKILSLREKRILWVVVGLLAVGLPAQILVFPLLESHRDLDKKILAAQIKANKYERLIQRKDALQKKYQAISFVLKNSSGAQETIVEGLSELESLARESGIRILDIRPQLLKKDSSIKETGIELKAAANMEGFIRFIYKVERSLTLFKIKKIQLTTKPGSPMLEGSFSIARLAL